GMPQCVNSETQYEKAFGAEAVARCRGILNGAPCEPKNHGVGTGDYAHDYGCYQCTLDALATKGCSSDAFAIRPDKFTITSSSSHWPDLLTSGEDYNVTLNALTFSGSVTNDYNISNARNVLELNTSARYFPNNILDTSGGLVGVFSIGTDDFNISNGVSVKSGVATNKVIPINFSDVGKVSLQVIDKIWSAIDDDDTAQNCNGTYVCGETNTTFIPSDFNISSLSLSNNNGNPGTFTYMGRVGDNETILKMMSGRFDINVRAQNKQGSITKNFRQGAWENTVSITPSVFDTINGEANTTKITTLAVGFGTGGDANGSKHIGWNESNTSLMLRFNFNKSQNTPVDPFRVDGNETNMSVSSVYTGSAPIGMRIISGKRVATADQNVTFVYGRYIPRDVRIFGKNSFTVNGWYEVYNTTMINGTALAPSRNGAQWYVNRLHSDLVGNYDGDANVTVLEVANSPQSFKRDSVVTNGVESYGFNPQIPPYSAKAHINTDPWLWYGVNALDYADPSPTNLDCQTHPCFNITVAPAVGRAGSSTSDDLKSDKANKSTSAPTGVTYDYSPALQ
ncbi:MAG: hypothetical protein IE884_02540, partial [Sulfuricurvum sp.]|nr:hypothetical protein [Sulfuricurvum sp.]